MRKHILPAIVSILTFSHPSLAQEHLIPTDGAMIGSSGKCEVFIVEDKQSSCDKMLYMHVNSTGRTSFNFVTPTDAAIGFSGGPDAQPTPENYILTVDSILNSRRRIPSDGKCTANVSTDGQFVHKIECSATTKEGSFRVKFVGDGKPVKMDPLPSMK